MVVSGVMGSAGLLPAIHALKSGKNLALANKETLVIAGELVLREAKKTNSQIIPIDSEHSAIFQALKYNRRLLLSPTASGKSLIIYMLSKYYPERKLIIVPTTALVHQMASDFEDYGYKDQVHKITAGANKDTDTEITVT